jgi:hypothetical protein
MVGVVCMAVLQGLSIGVENMAARHASAIPLMYISALLPSITLLYFLVFPNTHRAFITPKKLGNA